MYEVGWDANWWATQAENQKKPYVVSVQGRGVLEIGFTNSYVGFSYILPLFKIRGSSQTLLERYL